MRRAACGVVIGPAAAGNWVTGIGGKGDVHDCHYPPNKTFRKFPSPVLVTQGAARRLVTLAECPLALRARQDDGRGAIDQQGNSGTCIQLEANGK
jgi:hypothetical protein